MGWQERKCFINYQIIFRKRIDKWLDYISRVGYILPRNIWGSRNVLWTSRIFVTFWQEIHYFMTWNSFWVHKVPPCDMNAFFRFKNPSHDSKFPPVAGICFMCKKSIVMLHYCFLWQWFFFLWQGVPFCNETPVSMLQKYVVTVYFFLSQMYFFPLFTVFPPWILGHFWKTLKY